MHVVICIAYNMILTYRTYLLLYINILHPVLSRNFPFVYPCLEIGKFSSTLIIMSLVVSILPMYVVLKSVLSLNFVMCDVSLYMPSYLSKYSSFNLSPSHSISTVRSLFVLNCYTIFYAVCNLMVSQSN